MALMLKTRLRTALHHPVEAVAAAAVAELAVLINLVVVVAVAEQSMSGTTGGPRSSSATQ